MSDSGHYRKYINKRLGAASLELIGAANQIIAEYEKAGHMLTLRQLYYQFVARGLLANKLENYNKLGNVISDGRLCGLVSWTAIEDRGRNLKGLGFYSNPEEAIKRVSSSYRRDLWKNQDWRPEVWIEKEALVGVIGGICNKMRVDFFATKGYNSQSEQWNAGQRFARYIQNGQRPIIFHLGDHDPSGIDMTRDNQERLSMFAGTQIMVQRLALNMPQVEAFNPPPNPAKQTDSRFEEYRRQFGDSSWELDALDPRYIEQIIENAIFHVRDPKRWDEALALEVQEKQYLASLAEGNEE